MASAIRPCIWMCSSRLAKTIQYRVRNKESSTTQQTLLEVKWRCWWEARRTKRQAGVQQQQQQRIKIGWVNRLLRCHYIPFWIFSTDVCRLEDCQHLIFLIPHQYLPREENAAYILISAPLSAQKVGVYLVSPKVQSYWLARWNSEGFHEWEAVFSKIFFLKKNNKTKPKVFC